jgi:hypothetical protein
MPEQLMDIVQEQVHVEDMVDQIIAAVDVLDQLEEVDEIVDHEALELFDHDQKKLRFTKKSRMLFHRLHQILSELFHSEVLRKLVRT